MGPMLSMTLCLSLTPVAADLQNEGLTTQPHKSGYKRVIFSRPGSFACVDAPLDASAQGVTLVTRIGVSQMTILGSNRPAIPDLPRRVTWPVVI